MVANKSVLTTGEVAKICNVAPRTVSKWFDTGQLRGYRIPGSKDRRIPLDQLLRFMHAHGIPLNGLESGKRRVLVIDSDAALCEALQIAMGKAGCEVLSAGSALDAGAAAEQLKPQVVIVDTSLPGLLPHSVVRFFRVLGEPPVPKLIGVGGGLTDGQGQGLLQAGFDAYLKKPFDARSLMQTIERLEHTRNIPELV
jgi:excisionase family DNA binding protein